MSPYGARSPDAPVLHRPQAKRAAPQTRRYAIPSEPEGMSEPWAQQPLAAKTAGQPRRTPASRGANVSRGGC